MLVYVCSPYSGDVKVNTELAKAYCRYVVEQGNVPIAPHLMFPQFLDEETERELALQMDLVLMESCNEVWVFGTRVTNGMRAEIAYAKHKDIKIRFFKTLEGRL